MYRCGLFYYLKLICGCFSVWHLEYLEYIWNIFVVCSYWMQWNERERSCNSLLLLCKQSQFLFGGIWFVIYFIVAFASSRIWNIFQFTGVCISVWNIFQFQIYAQQHSFSSAAQSYLQAAGASVRAFWYLYTALTVFNSCLVFRTKHCRNYTLVS